MNRQFSREQAAAGITTHIVRAFANIAFIKYWGRVDHDLFLPANSSISMTVSGCATTASASFSSDNKEDRLIMRSPSGQATVLSPEDRKTRALYAHIQRIRNVSGCTDFVTVEAENNFPSDAGLASSASSFCAITGALLLAFGLQDVFDNKTEFSRYVRLAGSGSAVRSVYGGFVQWNKGDSCETSVAEQLANEDHWDLVDIIAIVETKKKKYSSSFGHEIAETSPFFTQRISCVSDRIGMVRHAILEKDFTLLGGLIEADSDCMHKVMRTSEPSLNYWNDATKEVMREVQRLRNKGVEAYYTIDAGANVHVLCQLQDVQSVHNAIQKLDQVSSVIINKAAKGVQVLS
ncbi:MAG: diphosphomevalonate decarboxylase [Candidatus Magasanikbacteria bacterium]|nr:diphosphomevalonate decarboxylase [Candidatus Magasanikbacteria bacterium]|tara:strand:- start:291 stop:1334 length:1044 start_codon:yes stop_codon:yes gene_type:complete